MSCLKVLAHDTRGVAAIEFAFLAPVLILFYFGMVQFCQGFMALKRTGHVASMVADLVSRTDAVTKQELEQILDIGYLIMAPFPTKPLEQRVSSVTRLDVNTYRVDWSVVRGSEILKDQLEVAKVDIPSNLLAHGQSIIVAEANYGYKSPLAEVAPSAARFSRTAYLRPRTIDLIPCKGC